MTLEELREKTRALPYAPGVYLMSDQSNQIIYVGKAKKLKNRVSQYFQDTASHTRKTRMMVSQVDHFDVIVASSEFEALVLECSLIKRHMPKYNILLKDDKGYPYLRLDMREEFPTLTMAGRVVEDGASYYGPFGGRSLTQRLIDAIRLALKLPGCSKKFPRDQGKDRPCLNYHMGNCAGWCQLHHTAEEYRAEMRKVQLLLSGKYQQAAAQIRAEMEAQAEQLHFEQAAALRRGLRPEIVPVGVFVDEDPQVILALLERDIIGMVQLHGQEDEAMVRFLKERGRRPVIKAVRAERAEDLLAWKDSAADYLLFDGGKGDGRTFDWSLAGAAGQCGKPFFLAGGLDPDNVLEGARLFRPYGLDVSSGVEEAGASGPVKSPEKIARFVRTVREWKKD